MSSDEQQGKPDDNSDKVSVHSDGQATVTENDEIVEIDFRKMGGTIYPVLNFNMEQDSKDLRKAMKGLGTDEKKLIKILANRSLKQRREINRAFNHMYASGNKNDTLDKQIASDTSGYFRTALLTLLENFGTIDAQSIRSAIKSKDITQIVMTVGTRTTKQINDMQEKYQELYKITLGEDLQQSFGGAGNPVLLMFFSYLITSSNRTISHRPVHKSVAQQEFQVLSSYGVETWDQPHVMNDILPILTSRSYESIYYVSNVLWNEAHRGHTIVQHVRAGLRASEYKTALLTYLTLITDLPAKSFAEAIYDCIISKKKETLTYYVISRSELDTLDIKKAFRDLPQNKDRVTLDEFIKKKLGKGDYEKLLREILTVSDAYDASLMHHGSQISVSTMASSRK